MKIAVLGTRGFPNVQGGVEAHCEKLYPRLAALGCDVTVFTRAPYVDPDLAEYKKIKLIALGCPKSKNFEAIIHTFKGIFAARKIKPDILHIQAIGPSLLIPLARLLGLKVVMTNHGPDYERKKWSLPAKFVLKLGELAGCCFANEIICISEGIGNDIKLRYGRNPHTIPNGADIPVVPQSDDALNKYSLTKSKYILMVGRFVPEKGFNDLVDAFNEAGLKDWKLVIIGKADHETEYSRELKQKASKNRNIILTGFLSGRPLEEIYSHAGLFILPSYHEGFPIVLLEALSYGLSCIVSDIPANRELGLPHDRYFAPGDVEALTRKISEFLVKPLDDREKRKQIDMVTKNYDWDMIARRTLSVYEQALKRRNQ